MSTKPVQKKTPWTIAGWILGVVLVLMIVALATVGGSEDPPLETGELTVAGTALPRLEDPTSDPARGMAAPTWSGLDLDGSPVAFDHGRPTVMAFLAHWCSHCQAEVPVVVDWLGQGRLPDTVDLIGVATGNDASLPNYPPTQWLDREGWTVPTLLDDDTVADAYGLSAFPYWVVISKDGTVLFRGSGEFSPDQLDQLAALALDGSTEGPQAPGSSTVVGDE